MKKVLMLVCFFTLFSLLGNAIQTYSVSGSNTVKTDVDGSVQLDFNNMLVASGNSLEATFGYVGKVSSFIVLKPESSTGNYTSATISWKQYPSSGTIEDNAVVVSTSTLAVDVFLTEFLTSLFTVSLDNPVATQNYVTASMTIK